MKALGRLNDSEIGKPVIADDPSKQMEAVMSAIDALNAAVIAVAGGADENDATVEALVNIELKL